MKKFLKRKTDSEVRTARQRGTQPNLNLKPRAFDAVAFAAVLEIMG